MIWDDVVMDDNLMGEGKKKLHLEDIQCQNIKLFVMSWRKMRPDSLFHKDLPHMGISRGEFEKNHKYFRYFQGHNKINSK